MVIELFRVLKLMEMDLAMVKGAVIEETLNERLEQAKIVVVYSALEKIGHKKVCLEVLETRWPSKGDPDEAGATPVNSMKYNGNLCKLMQQKRETLMRPNEVLNTFVFILFYENMNLGLTSERNFGLFKPDGTPAFALGLGGTALVSSGIISSSSNGSPPSKSSPPPVGFSSGYMSLSVCYISNFANNEKGTFSPMPCFSYNIKMHSGSGLIPFVFLSFPICQENITRANLQITPIAISVGDGNSSIYTSDVAKSGGHIGSLGALASPTGHGIQIDNPGHAFLSENQPQQIVESAQIAQCAKSLNIDNAFKRTINRSCGLHKYVEAQSLKFNVFLINFQNEEDKDEAWSYRPWSVRGYHLLLQPWKEDVAMEKMPLDRAVFWAQVDGLPTAFISKENAIKIGKRFENIKFFEDDQYFEEDEHIDKPLVEIPIDNKVVIELENTKNNNTRGNLLCNLGVSRGAADKQAPKNN